MSIQERNRKVPLAVELGYKFTLHATYFDSIQDKTIDAKFFSDTVQYIREEIDTINEYWIFFFGSALDPPTEIETQEGLREYLRNVLRITKAKIHVQYGDPVEAAFELGAFFALNDLAPPNESMHDSYLGVIRKQLIRLGIKIDDVLKASLPNLLSEETEIRSSMRTEVFNRIENLFGERVATSWLRGVEFTAGTPGAAQFKKA